jgi:hypothetical protein
MAGEVEATTGQQKTLHPIKMSHMQAIQTLNIN